MRLRLLPDEHQNLTFLISYLSMFRSSSRLASLLPLAAFAVVVSGCGGGSGPLPTTGGSTGEIRSLTETVQSTHELDVLGNVAYTSTGALAWWNDTELVVNGTHISPPAGRTNSVIKGYFNGTVVGTDADGAWTGIVGSGNTITVTKSFVGADIPAFSSKTGETALTYRSEGVLTKLSVLSISGTETTVPLPSGVTSFAVTGVAHGRMLGNTGSGIVMELSATAAPVTLQNTAPGTTFAVVTPVDVDRTGRVVGVGFVTTPTPHSVGLLWSASGALTVAPAGPFGNTTFSSISEAGIVGNSSSNGDSPQSVGIIYQNGAIVDANSLLVSSAASSVEDLLVITDDGKLLGLGRPKSGGASQSLILGLKGN